MIRSLFVSTFLLLSAFFNRVTNADEANCIEHIRANEALYSDLDVRIHRSYASHREADTVEQTDPSMERLVISDSEQSLWSVEQQSRFRVELSGHNEHFAGSSLEVTSVGMYDGQVTRIFDGNLQAANETAGLRTDKHIFYPHMLLFRDVGSGCRGAVKLSTYLAGGEGLYFDSDCRWREGAVIDVAWGDLDVFRDLQCRRVDVTLLSGEREVSKWNMWLAVDRNFLPVRVVGYSIEISSTIPHSEALVEEFRELSPGIWFPFRAVKTTYDYTKLHEGTQEPRLSYEYLVESASLNPMYEDEFFRDVEYPTGTVIYQILDDKIVSGERVGGPSPLTQSRSRLWPWLIVANVIFITLLLGALWRRRRAMEC